MSEGWCGSGPEPIADQGRVRMTGGSHPEPAIRDARHVEPSRPYVGPVDLRWDRGSPTVRWEADGHEVVKEHPRPVRSAAYVSEPPCVVIVEEMPNGVPSNEHADNAVVYELDGVERLRLVPPEPPQGWLSRGFDQCFYNAQGLTAVWAVRNDLVWAYADLQTGQLGPVSVFR